MERKNIKPTDNQIFYYNLHSTGARICRYKRGMSYNIHIRTNRWQRDDFSMSSPECMLEATPEEILWYENCEKAGEFVPKPDMSYPEIY